MGSRPVFEDDERRVAKIRSYDILTSLPTEAFDAVARLVSSVCDTPAALVTLIDATHTHSITHVGIDIEPIPREVSFCAHAIRDPGHLTIVPDARADERFRDNPLVVGEPFVRFYAGMPLVSPDGFALGTLCVLDVVPRDLSADARATLRLAAGCVMAILEEHRTSVLLSTALAEQRVSAGRLALLESVAINAHEGVMVLDTAPYTERVPTVVFANASALRITGWKPERLPAPIDTALWSAIGARDGIATLASVVSSNAPHVTEAYLPDGDGRSTYAELRFSPIVQNDPDVVSRWLVLIRDLSDRNRADIVERRVESISARNGELAAEIERRRDVERRLSFAAAHDSLTDLPNRSYFIERLRARFDVSRRREDGVPFGVMFVDIDRFKAVNDSLGHMRGDELLVTLARRLQGCVRVQDVVARLGGDEFTILIDAAGDRRTIAHLAERIGRAIAGPVRLGRSDVNVSASIGIVLDDGTHASAEDLLRDADIAMFHAKARGRNRHEFFREELRARVVTEARLEKALRDALDRNEFRLVYQPIVSLADPSFPILGFEALLRWRSRYQTEIGTPGIIAAAEENGLIARIGQWALDEAARQVGRWKLDLPSGAPRPYVTVNVSPRHLIERDFGSRFEATLADAGVSPDDLALEITEGALVHEDEHVNATVGRLRARGVRLFLDEFGTGYASLGDLRRCAVDWLKIDRSFVSGYAGGLADEAIVDGIIALAHRLGICTVAEGVETQEQIDRLIALKCECAQGYAFGPPLDADLATETMLRAWRSSAPV